MAGTTTTIMGTSSASPGGETKMDAPTPSAHTSRSGPMAVNGAEDNTELSIAHRTRDGPLMALVRERAKEKASQARARLSTSD